jgi:hypothetical protein
MAPAAAISPRKRLQQQQSPPAYQQQYQNSIGGLSSEDGPLEVISLNSPSTASEGSSSSSAASNSIGMGQKTQGFGKNGSSRRVMLPPFHLHKDKDGKGGRSPNDGGGGVTKDAKALALVRTKVRG